jgi:hypothetical protein
MQVSEGPCHCVCLLMAWLCYAYLCKRSLPPAPTTAAVDARLGKHASESMDDLQTMLTVTASQSMSEVTHVTHHNMSLTVLCRRR